MDSEISALYGEMRNILCQEYSALKLHSMYQLMKRVPSEHKEFFEEGFKAGNEPFWYSYVRWADRQPRLEKDVQRCSVEAGEGFTRKRMSYSYLEDEDILFGHCSKMNFSNAYLKKVIFRGGPLHDLYGKNAHLVDCVFYTDMQGSDFKGSMLRNTSFTHCDLHHASFQGATIKNVEFVDSYITSLDMSNSTCENVTFDRSLTGDFTGATLKGVDFRRVSVADLKGYPFHWFGATYDRETKWPLRFKPHRHGLTLID